MERNSEAKELLREAIDEGRWAGFEVLNETEKTARLARKLKFSWTTPIFGLLLSAALALAYISYRLVNDLEIDRTAMVWNGLPLILVTLAYTVYYLQRREEVIDLSVGREGGLLVDGLSSSLVALRARLRPRSTTRSIVVSGVLAAITIILGASQVGFIPVPTPAARATIMHIPVIIGGLLEGWPVGGLLGLIFGMLSFLLAQIPVFKDPLVAILPRMFIGVTAYFTYRALRGASLFWTIVVALTLALLALTFSYQTVGTSLPGAIAIAIVALVIVGALVYLALRRERQVMAVAMAAVAGTLTNTVLVLTVATLRRYWTPGVALGIGITHGIPEIIVAVIIVLAVILPWQQIESGRGKEEF